jgi:hypothetical protein
MLPDALTETDREASLPTELAKVRSLIDAARLPDDMTGTVACHLGRHPDL